MKAFLTGSIVYGKHKKGSDVDLVVMVSERDLRILSRHAEPQFAEADAYKSVSKSKSLRFGKLNLICVTDPISYGIWERGTNLLMEFAVRSAEYIPRTVAVKFLKELRKFYRITLEKGEMGEPIVEECLDKKDKARQ